MSDTILHPVIHSRTPMNDEMQALNPSKQSEFEEAHKASMGVLHDYLSKGYQILDAFDVKSGTWNVRQYLLYMPDDVREDVSKLMLVHLYDCSIEQAYSKTYDVSFDYLKCEFSTNRYVNIFDHPDNDRNTWNICTNRLWTWEGFQEQIYKGYGVQAIITKDGDFYKLVDVLPEISHHEYRLHIDTMFKAKGDDSE